MGEFVMSNISRERINRLIYRYILEIFLVVLFLIISFQAFTQTGLSASASVAEVYNASKLELQVLYGRTNSNRDSVLQFENLLDRGELEIKNPNSSTTNIDIKMILTKGELKNLNSIAISVDDEFIDVSQAIEKDGTYEIALKSTKLKGYTRLKHTISIYGDALNTPILEYTFKVTESFYN